MKQMYVWLASVGVVFLTFSSSAQSWRNGLTSYFPFNGNVNDMVGGNNGTVSNAVFTMDRFQNANSAYYFNGSNSAVLVPAATVNNLTNGTLSAWVELDENTQEVIFAKESEGSDSSGVLSVGGYVGGGGANLVGDPGRVYFHSYNGAVLASSTALLSTGVWHQVVVTFSTTNCAFYIDGATGGSAPGNFTIPNEPYPTGTTMGYWYSAFPPGYYGTFAGKLDDFRVFNRVLSSDDVSQMYASDTTQNSQSWTNGLTSYFPFNGNANDVVGGNNGTVSNAVLTTDRFQTANSAYYFNGSNSAVLVPAATVNNLTNGTLSAWVELDQNTQEVIFAKEFEGSDSSGILSVGSYADSGGGRFVGDAGRIYFHSYNGAQLASSTALLSAGVWHQVAVTFSTTNCAFYIDGAPAGSTSGNFTIPNEPDPTGTTIGYWYSAFPPGYYGTFAGKLDDFRVFDRVLSSDDVSQMYATETTSSSLTTPSWTNGLTSYFPFNGNANDVVGGNNGTVSNAVLTTDRFQNGNSAYYFNGSNSAVLVPAATVNNLTNGTLSAWVELDENTQEVIFAKEFEGSDSSGVLSVGSYVGGGGARLEGDAGRVYFHSYNGAVLAASTTLLATGVWYQVVVTFSRTNCAFYIDGAPAGSTAGNFTIPDEPDPTGTAIGFWYSAFSPGDYGTFTGKLDGFRVFDRALSSNEVIEMYASEVPPGGLRTAQAVAEVVNGAIVGVQILDGGYGYTNVPSIRFIGLGSGAQATVVVSNSSIIAINVLNPGNGYDTNSTLVLIDGPVFYNPVLSISQLSLLTFSNLTPGGAYLLQKSVINNWANLSGSITVTNTTYSQMFSGVVGSGSYRLVTYPVPVPARAVAQVVNGFLVGAYITSAGTGYVTNPIVTIVGGGGSNGTAVAQVSAGRVIKISITSTGSGYTTLPAIQIAAPPILAIAPQVQPLISINSSLLVPYENYQLLVASALGGIWAPLAGGSFLATNSSNTQLIFLTNGTSLFRLQYLP